MASSTSDKTLADEILESAPAQTLVSLFSSSGTKVDDKNDLKPVNGTNEQLAARLIELEEQNKLLLSENSVLGESVKLYQSLLEDSTKDLTDTIPQRSGHHGGASSFKKGQRRRQKERASKIISAAKTTIAVESVTSDMSEDALMVGTLNHLTALVKRLALSKVQRDDAEQRRKQALEEQVKNAAPGFHALDIPDETNEREESLEDSLRHVFVDSVHLLSELIIDPTSMLATECSEYFTGQGKDSAASDIKRDRGETAAGDDSVNNTPSKSPSKNAKEEWLRKENTERSKYSQSSQNVRHPMTWLLDQFPVLPRGEGAQYDCKDWLPLHWACMSDANELIDVETLMAHHGSSAYYDMNVPPLLLAVAKDKPNIDIVTTLISYFNAAAVQEEAEKSFAADIPASPSSDSPGIVDIVSIANEHDGVYPLMIAAAYNDNDQILQLFHEICPKSMWEPDLRGWRAIHYAALKGHLTAVKYLIEQHPKCASAITRDGSYALHHAARNHSILLEEGESLAMLMEILNQNTNAISVADNNGALPLHNAVKEGTLEGVQFLCQTYSKAVKMEDDEGLLPMHYASSRSEALPHKTEIIEYILKQ
jgi:ankyrin repeat protein